MASLTFVQASRIHPGGNRKGSAEPTRRGLQPLDLAVADGEFVALVGQSGCGKTTTLRFAAGLSDPGSVDSGQVFVGDADVTRQQPSDRGISMVFQSYALYPHRTGRGNIEFPLRIRRLGQATIEERVRTYAGMLQLTPDLLERKPGQMSGGERQRVAVARALAPQPQVLLMDEPLGALDAQLRELVRTALKEQLRALGLTTLYVTHDQVEAASMADRVCVLRDGVVVQLGTPEDLQNDPVDTFVAGFVGEPTANLFTTGIVDGAIQVGTWTHPVPRHLTTDRAALTIGLRPHHLHSGPDGIRAQVVATHLAGDRWQVRARPLDARIEFLRREGLDVAVTTLTGYSPDRLPIGEIIALRPDSEAILYFDPLTEQRLR